MRSGGSLSGGPAYAAGGGALLMRVNVCIQKPSDHSLVLSLVFGRFELEKLHTLLAQGKRHLDALLTKRQLGRRRQEIGNHLDIAKWLICVSDFPFHKLPFLCANTRRQKCEQRRFNR
jgi:hypothetical protein